MKKFGNRDFESVTLILVTSVEFFVHFPLELGFEE